MSNNYGASQEDWQHFAFVLGLVDDLLPVVSDPTVPISEKSKMSALGKTPSIINRNGHAAGIKDWTSQVTTGADIRRWKSDPRLGICLQTRHVRAIDIDIDDPALADAVLETIWAIAPDLPVRSRPNSGKMLTAFRLPGEYSKRIIRTETGIIEFLATGQQFVAIGTHPSGERYGWHDLGDEFPELTPEQFEAIWSTLIAGYGVEAHESKAKVNSDAKLAEAALNDPVAQYLHDHGHVISTESDGRLHIICPFADQHSTEGAESATTYFPANTGGFAQGHFRCLHAHCEHRTDYEFQLGIGFADDFVDLTNEPAPVPDTHTRFELIQAAQFATARPTEWLIKNVLPKAEVVVIYGDSGSGKTFITVDMVLALARGVEWRGYKTKPTGVAYIAAEGSGGFRKRLRAYGAANEIDLSSIPFYVIADVPNFLEKADAVGITNAINAAPTVPGVIVVDTWAQTTAGGNENSGEDMGKALKHCRLIHKQTGALIILVHHSGKNAANGARGWSGLRAAADAEFEVLSSGTDRVMTVTKQKDGEMGSEFGFRLQVVPLDMDEDGDVITSCVIEHTDEAHAHAAKSVKAYVRMGANERAVFNTARDLVGLDGMAPDRETVVVTAAGNMPLVDTMNDKRRQNALRALKSLLEKGTLVEEDGRIVVAGKEGDDAETV